MLAQPVLVHPWRQFPNNELRAVLAVDSTPCGVCDMPYIRFAVDIVSSVAEGIWGVLWSFEADAAAAALCLSPFHFS